MSSVNEGKTCFPGTSREEKIETDEHRHWNWTRAFMHTAATLNFPKMNLDATLAASDLELRLSTIYRV